jgi:hypothetical protein
MVECSAWGGDYPIIGQKLGASFMITNRIQMIFGLEFYFNWKE